MHPALQETLYSRTSLNYCLNQRWGEEGHLKILIRTEVKQAVYESYLKAISYVRKTNGGKSVAKGN